MSLDKDVDLDTFIQAKDDLSGADIRVYSLFLNIYCSLFVWKLV